MVVDRQWCRCDGAEKNARFFGVSEEILTATRVDQEFSAANGSPVRMCVEAQVHVDVLLEDSQGRRAYESASMHVWVAKLTTIFCRRPCFAFVVGHLLKIGMG